MEIFDKFAKKAFVFGIIGLVTCGFIPAFGAISIAYAAAAKRCPKELNSKSKGNIKCAIITSIVSFALFVADIALILIILKAKGRM